VLISLPTMYAVIVEKMYQVVAMLKNAISIVSARPAGLCERSTTSA
jgi:hypothetical protein